MSVDSQLKPFYLKNLPGMNVRLEERDLAAQYVRKAQNVRSEESVGSVKKRPPLAQYNSASLGTGGLVGAYRYYKSDGTAKFIVIHGTKAYVGTDSTGVLTDIRTLSNSGKRSAFVTYKDLLIVSNGYDNPWCYDGATDNVTWELGSCKALTGAGTGITKTSVSYAVTMDTDTYVCGAVSNTIATLTNQSVELSYIPLGPAGTTNRKIYRKDSSTSGAYRLVATITNNTATTYTDTTADVSGATAMPSVTDDMPVGNVLLIYKERLFIAGDPSHPNRIYYSNPYFPGYIQQTVNLDYMDISPDDNDEIMGLGVQSGVIWAIKKNTIRPLHITTAVSGESSATWYADDPVCHIGSPCKWSIVQTPLGVMFLGWDHWYAFNGSTAEPIVDEFATEDILSSLYQEVVTTYVNNTLHAAYSDRTTAAQYNNRVMVYNFKRKFLSFDTINANCFAVKRGDDENNELYYGDSVNGYLYQAENTEIDYRLQKKTDCLLGTQLNVFVGGTEDAPYIEPGSSTAALAIPEGICIFWDDESENPGSGWTEITGKTDFYIAFNSAATPGTETAATTHTHPFSGTLTSSNTETSKGGELYAYAAVRNHTHTVSGTTGATSIELKYFSLRMFYKNTTTTEYEFPIGAIVMYDQASPPEDGWLELDDTVTGYYPRLGTADLGLATVPTHTHTFSATSDSYADSWQVTTGSASYRPHGTHTHGVSGTSNAASSEDMNVANVSFRFMKKVGNTSTWDGLSYYVYCPFYVSGAVSNGWTEVTDYDGMFLRCGNTAPSTGTASGLSHSHTITTGTSGDADQRQGDNTSYETTNSCLKWEHTHPYSLTTTTASATTPKYISVRLVKKVLGKMVAWNAGIEAASVNGAWVSPSLEISAQTLGRLYWNETRTGSDDVQLFVRTGATSAAVTAGTSCTATASTDLFNAVGHGLSNGDRVMIGGTAVPTGISAQTMYYVVGVSGADFQVSLTSGGAAVDFSSAGTAVTFKKWTGAYTDSNGSSISETASTWLQYAILFTCADTTVSRPQVYFADGYCLRFTYLRGAADAESSVEYIYSIGWRNMDEPDIDKIFKKIITVHEGTQGSLTVQWETENASNSFVVSLLTYPKRWSSFFHSTAMGQEILLTFYKNDTNDFVLKEIQGVYTPQPMLI